MLLQPGDKAPAFSHTDQHGGTVELSQFKGHKVLVYFYPKAGTPGCTQQSCALRDVAGRVGGTAIVGISPDAPVAQARFDTKHALGFPLLSDRDHATAEAYGVWQEKKSYGRTFMGILRSAFLVDAEGRVERAGYGVKPAGTATNLLRALEAE